MRRKGGEGKEGRVKRGGAGQDEKERGIRKGRECKEGRNGAG